MDLQACTAALCAKLGDSSGLNATLEFDFELAGDMSVAMKLPRVV